MGVQESLSALGRVPMASSPWSLAKEAKSSNSALSHISQLLDKQQWEAVASQEGLAGSVCRGCTWLSPSDANRAGLRMSGNSSLPQQ